jgi:general secretion pathway protein K
MSSALHRRQSGSVLIVTLWTITLLTILVTALASQTRLSARVAFFHQQDLQDWADLLAAMNQAEMEVLLERQPRSLEGVDNPEELDDNPFYRFNGQELTLYYPQAEGIKVRIQDHAGKINIRELSPERLRRMLEKRLGEDANDQIEELLTAWNDWRDLNDNAGLTGAERDYYESLDPPYIPRNGNLETVEELLQIRGFAEVFGDVDLDAAFTLYGDGELVNLNLATIEAMRLLPGLDDALIAEILAFRAENEFRGNGDVAQLVPAENMGLLRPWLNSRKMGDHYTVMVYREQEDGTASTAYAELIQALGPTERPRVLKVMPYHSLPLLQLPDTELPSLAASGVE